MAVGGRTGAEYCAYPTEEMGGPLRVRGRYGHHGAGPQHGAFVLELQ